MSFRLRTSLSNPREKKKKLLTGQDSRRQLPLELGVVVLPSSRLVAFRLLRSRSRGARRRGRGLGRLPVDDALQVLGPLQVLLELGGDGLFGLWVLLVLQVGGEVLEGDLVELEGLGVVASVVLGDGLLDVFCVIVHSRNGRRRGGREERKREEGRRVREGRREPLADERRSRRRNEDRGHLLSSVPLSALSISSHEEGEHVALTNCLFLEVGVHGGRKKAKEGERNTETKQMLL